MKNGLRYLLSSLVYMVFVSTQAQVAPGSWRTHYVYDRSFAIELHEGHIYSQARHSLLSYNLEDHQLRPFTAVDGLHSASISSLKGLGDILVIGYVDGRIDLLSSSTLFHLKNLQETSLQLPKAIHTAFASTEKLYVGGEFGLLVFNRESLRLENSYLELGKKGETKAVYGIEIQDDSLFLQTADGIIHGALSDERELLDPRHWKRLASVRDTIYSMARSREQLYCLRKAGPRTQLLSYRQGNWAEEENWAEDYTFLTNSPKGLLIGAKQALLLRAQGQSVAIPLAHEVKGLRDASYVDDLLWISDEFRGLGRSIDQGIEWFLPSSPHSSVLESLASAKDQVYAFYRGTLFPALRDRATGCSIWEKGKWSHLSLGEQKVSDIVDLLQTPEGDVYVATFDHGIWKRSSEGFVSLPQANEPLRESSLHISAMSYNRGHILAASHQSNLPDLLRYEESKGWQQIMLTPTTLSTPYRGAFSRLLAHPMADQVWGVLSHEGLDQLLLLRPESHLVQQVSFEQGSPSRIHALLLDKSNRLWIGTSRGLYVMLPLAFTAVEQLPGAAPLPAIRPAASIRIQGRLVLQEEAIYDLLIDGGDRLWCATSRGIWVIELGADRISRRFSSEESPISSTSLAAALAMTQEGSLFMAHNQGILSYRSRSSTPAANYHQLRVVPNPVQASFSGEVSISGLPRSSYVRITTIDGQLIRTLEVRGGTATWDTMNEKGTFVPTGIYLIHSAEVEEKGTYATKIAIFR